MNGRIRSILFSRGVLALGSLVAIALVTLFLATGRHRTAEVSVLALIVLLLLLIAQLLLDGRASLDRERQLINTAAALREATAQLEKLAATDPLTGIGNRRAFFDALGVEFRRAQRYSRSLSVLMIDIDNFKQANDLGGHVFGDYVLTAVARILRDNLRESDLVGRYGGEEFAVILPEADAGHAAAVAEKLRVAVETFEFRTDRYPLVDDTPMHFTITVGTSSLPLPAGGDGETLVAQADEALYEAKRAGKNRVHRFGHGVTSGGPPAAPSTR